MADQSGAQLAEFANLTKRRVPWDVRARKIKERFPSIDQLDWNKAFANDLDLFARVLRDILKLEQAQPGRPGPRPSLDVATATRRMEQFFGRDYTLEPFHVAFRILAGERSIRHLARKTDLDRNVVYRLLRNEIEPDAWTVEQVAKAFGKAPSYFLEYRILFILCGLHARLMWSPESTVGVYRKLAQERPVVLHG